VTRAIVILVLLAIAACGEIPQPFRHQGKADPLARPDLLQTEPDDGRAPGKRMTARLGAFAGLPGDGNQAMRQALKGALERRGVLVVGEGGDVIVTPGVQLGEPGADGVALTLTWTVATTDGREMGQVKQKGAAPSQQINGRWGRLAHDIAEGGADGIVKVVRTAFTTGRGD